MNGRPNKSLHTCPLFPKKDPANQKAPIPITDTTKKVASANVGSTKKI